MSFSPYFLTTQTGGVPRPFQARNEEYISVKDFGAKGDGATNDTVAIQAAINYAHSIGGGRVMFPPALYYTTGVLNLFQYVSLCGVAAGYFDTNGPNGGVGNINPLTNVTGPMLLITNTTTPFITQPTGNGVGCNSITDLQFGYPNQVQPTSTTPTVYPATVYLQQGGSTIDRCSFYNSYDAIKIHNGRCRIQNSMISVYRYGIDIDFGEDYTIIDNVLFLPFFDYIWGKVPPQTIETFVKSNAIGLRIGRVDGLQASNIGMDGFFNTCIAMIDGADTPSPGYGNFSNVDLDFQGGYGISCQSSRSLTGGFQFTNVHIGSAGTCTLAIFLPSGGSDTPLVNIRNGSTHGTFTLGLYLIQNGTLRLSSFLGGDVPGGVIASPAFPGTGVTVTNTTPYWIQAYINLNGAAYAGNGIVINGTPIGTPSAHITLGPNQTVQFTYGGGVPTWTWFTA